MGPAEMAVKAVKSMFGGETVFHALLKHTERGADAQEQTAKSIRGRTDLGGKDDE
jgi:hypothetical protein